MNPVFTIGHSRHSLEDFLRLLKQHRIDAVADVRSAPFSRFAQWFNKETISEALKANGIKYVFLGKELGGRPSDRSCYSDHGQVLFDRLSRTEPFLEGIRRILSGAERFRIALMCSEKDPLECHRGILVSRVLDEQGVQVRHILSNGSIEPYFDSIDRLLKMLKLSGVELFCSKEELIAEALSRQEAKIAYVDGKLKPC